MNSNMNIANCMSNGLTARQLQLSNTFRRLWFEHVMWTRSFIMSAIFGLPDLDAVTKRLLRNPTDFASALRPFYESQRAMKFGELLSDHLLIAGQIVTAAKAGDSQKVQDERVKWYANADEIADFLSGINPFWSKTTWQALLYDHLRMVEEEAARILTGKYEESITGYDAMQAEAQDMADYLTCGIIRQFMIR